MRWVSSAAQVRELDRRLIEDAGLPGVAVMEVAIQAVAAAIRAHHRDDAARGTVVVCGTGNNGGDGWGIARWLHGWGLPVRVWATGAPRTGTDAATMAAVARAVGVSEGPGVHGAALIVDAVFGTGLDRPVDGALREVLEAMRAAQAPVIAVDLPSGLHADSGQLLGVCVPAARTVTFGRAKPGLFSGAGLRHRGVLQVVDIGLDVGPGVHEAVAEWPTAADLASRWPRRAQGAHKGTSGRLWVVAGSTAMAGAAVLCCRGALAAGASLVTLRVPRGAIPRLAALPPEVMVSIGGPGDVLTSLGVPPGVAVAAGPGLGGGDALPDALQASLETLWRQHAGPVVFDADALVGVGAAADAPRVLTPHPGEAGRLLGRTAAEVEQDRLGSAAALADGAVALLKGPHTVVAAPGHLPSLNDTGGPVLATGGAGDVLTGVIGALLARGVSARDAARLAAWVHGAAGDQLSAARAEGWTASDVAAAIPQAVASLTAADHRGTEGDARLVAADPR